MLGKRKPGDHLDACSLRRQRFAAAVVLFVALAMPCFDLRAELLFRNLEQVNGRPSWSPIRKYSNPSDIEHARVSAGGAAAEVRVFLSGEITRADVDSADVLARLLKSGKQKIAGNTVWLASHGGDIDAAMELGRFLRKSGIFTFVGRNDECFSACVFAFMGGERRGVEGRLGIHRPYFSYLQDSPDRQSRFRNLQRVLKGYVDDMDFPASLYEAVMLVPPQSMQILAPEDLKKFYLVGISPSSEDVADAAAARRLELSMLEYLKYKARAPACAFPVADPSRCDANAQEATASGGAVDTQRAGNARAPARGALGSI